MNVLIKLLKYECESKYEEYKNKEKKLNFR